MENQQRQQVKKYLDLVLSRWKLITACFFVAVSLGLGAYIYMPKVYQSSALLSYEQQSINPARMAPEQENQGLRDTVSTLTEIVMSRNNLEQIIKQFNLYSEKRSALPIEDVIEIMREKITITPSQHGDTFTVDFQYGEQDKVMKVTNALAAKFIEENLKYREERATETSKYTEDELNMSKVVLDNKEQAMRDYKLQYYNEMPEQRVSNMARLSSLHEQLQGNQESIQDLERTKVMLQEQLSLQIRLAGSLSAGEVTGGVVQPLTGSQPVSNFERRQQLQGYLDSLLMKYTDKHPEVRRTRQMIDSLAQEAQSSENASSQTGHSGQAVQDPQVQQLKLQIKEISLNTVSLKEDQKIIRREIEKYEKWIDAAPVREAEWTALTRDYNELRRHYDYLVAQNLQAGSAEHLEHKQKGSKFKIVDPARFPEKPFKPDFKRVMLLAIGLGLAIGFGFTIGLDLIDTSFRDVNDLEQFLGIGVACSVPYVETARERIKKRVFAVCWVLIFFLCAIAISGAFLYFYRQGQIIL